jgi:hypothetical protein
MFIVDIDEVRADRRLLLPSEPGEGGGNKIDRDKSTRALNPELSSKSKGLYQP